jgi:hypothetical protein
LQTTNTTGAVETISYIASLAVVAEVYNQQTAEVRSYPEYKKIFETLRCRSRRSLVYITLTRFADGGEREDPLSMAAFVGDLTGLVQAKLANLSGLDPTISCYIRPFTAHDPGDLRAIYQEHPFINRPGQFIG